MDLRQLEMLSAVVDAGGYTKAGERLHVSHSAIHRQVRLLEHEVHDRILVRAGRHVELTETGEILLNLARRTRQDIASVQRQIDERNQPHSGHLRIGTGTTMLVFFLPPVLERFRQRFPGVEVQVMTGTADHVLEEIQRGNLDVGIVLAPEDMPPGGRPLEREVLYREEFVLAVGKDHPLARQKMVSPVRLMDFPFIMYSKTSHIRRLLERLFADAGLAPKISMELENEEAMEKMIEINMGVALLSKRRAVSDNFHHLQLAGRRIFCDVGLVFAKGEYVPRSVREFASLCRSLCPKPAKTALPGA